MAGEIAQAFVRIRPNTTGFKAETEAQVGSSLGGLKKIAALAGIGFGVEFAVNFAKGLAEHAADAQRQAENVVAEFGPAAGIIQKFADSSAAALGLSAHAANTAATQFGLVTNQLGLSQTQGAQMTVAFEKLAAAEALIHNKPVEQYLQRLPMALQGNVRGLRQFGITIDQNTIKQTAYALGIAKQGATLTTAQKAQAIFAFATQNLDKILAQAASHGGDLATRMKVLGAVWDNQKDKLGNLLLPIFIKVVNVLINDLPGAIRFVGRAAHDMNVVFSAVFGTLHRLFDPLGGLKNAFLGLAAALTIREVTNWITGLGRAASASKKATGDAQAQATAYDRLSAALERFVGAAGGATLAEDRLATAGAGAGAGANTTAARFSGATTGATGGTSTRRIVAPKLNLAPEEAQVSKLRRALNGIGTAASAGATRTRSAFGSAFSGIASVAGSATSRAAGAFTGLFRSIGAGAKALAIGVKTAFLEMLPILALTIAIQLIITHFSQIKAVAIAVARDIGTAWKLLEAGLVDIFRLILDTGVGAVKTLVAYWQVELNALLGAAEVIGGGIATALTLPLRAFLEAVNKLSGISIFGHHIFGFAKGLTADALSGLDTVTTDIVQQGTKRLEQVPGQLGKALTKNWGKVGQDAAKVGKDFSSLYGNLKDTVTQALNDSGKKVKAAAHTNATDTTTAANDTTAAVNNLANKNAAAVKSASSRLADLGRQLADAIGAQQKDLRDAVEQAKANMFSLADGLATAIGALLDAPLQAQQDRQTRASDKNALESLREQILLPGGKQLSTDPKKAVAELQALVKSTSGGNRQIIQDFLQQYQSALLTVQQDSVNLTKTTTTNALRNLADEFNKGGLSPAAFNKRLDAIIKSAHINRAAAKKILGEFGIDTLDAAVTGAKKQAAAIAAAPNVKDTTGLEAQVTKPLDVLHTDQKKIEQIQREIGNEHTKLLKQIAKSTAAAQKAAAKRAKIADQQAQQAAIRAKASKSQYTKIVTKNSGDGAHKAATYTGTQR